jgi:prepilin-type N-terminal cleavage/methylation domain-containing protein/prepilin-type processing-associated H-X9-DG protein
VKRQGFTLIELLVSIAIIAILIGLTLSAVQKVRAAAARAACINNLKQIALAAHLRHDVARSFPLGWGQADGNLKMAASGWGLHLLPWLDQTAILAQARVDYTSQPLPFLPEHSGVSRPIKIFQCPSDPRVAGTQVSLRELKTVAFTSYLGNCGSHCVLRDGTLIAAENTNETTGIRIADISDGTANTLLFGERPPSADFQYGWWYAGLGFDSRGSGDMIFGPLVPNPGPVTAGSPCGPGVFPFGPAANFDDPCAHYHYWSPHPGGANFAFADGSFRFLSYSANAILPALSTRAGRETVEIP